MKPRFKDAPPVALVALRADRDRYRAALVRIFQMGRGAHVEIAREALNHTDERTT